MSKGTTNLPPHVAPGTKFLKIEQPHPDEVHKLYSHKTACGPLVNLLKPAQRHRKQVLAG
jgi:hypothetical protein